MATALPNEVAEKENELVAALQARGGHAGNVSLQRELQWDDDQYWPIRDRLVDAGLLQLGRGKGGSVSLVVQEALPVEDTAQSGAIVTPDRVTVREDELYEPVAEVLKKEWARDMRFRSHIVEITARQGRRDTGGTWTRPDIVVAALRVFPHVPGKFFDLITFEIKPITGINVTAVFEALAHRRSATQACVWLHVPVDEAQQEAVKTALERVEDEAKRHGIGLIIATDPADYSSWDVRLRATRFEPDPEFLNEFIAQQLSALSRDELAQWFR